jgi:hypothetical protein
MPNRISKTKRPKRPTDPNEWAREMVDESTSNPPEPENKSTALALTPKSIKKAVSQGVVLTTSEGDPKAARKAYHEFVSIFMAEMGRKGGKIGGKRRLETLTPEKRRELALKAAKARWGRKRDITHKDTAVGG